MDVQVAWLYNLRGGDVLYNPVVHSYAIVTRDSAFYYVNKAKVDLKVLNGFFICLRLKCTTTKNICNGIAMSCIVVDWFAHFAYGVQHPQVEQYLFENGVEVRDYEAVFEDVEALASDEPSALKKSAEKNGHTNGHEIDEETASSESKPTEGLEDCSVRGPLHAGEGVFVWVDPGTCSYSVYSRVPLNRVILQQSPLSLAKALKVSFLCKYLFLLLS